MEESIADVCARVRSILKDCEGDMRRLQEHSDLGNDEQAYAGQHCEMSAQMELAVRACEDARMRCGKVLQYAADGVSIYDRSAQA